MVDIVEQVKLKIEGIGQLQRDKARKDGQREQVLKQLKDEFDLSSTKEVEDKLEEFGQELVKYEDTLKKLDDRMDKIIVEAIPPAESTTGEEQQ